MEKAVERTINGIRDGGSGELLTIDEKLKLSDTQQRIIHSLHKYGSSSRSQLMKRTKISRSTLYDNLVVLIIQGIVLAKNVFSGKPGRPKVFYCNFEDAKVKDPSDLFY